MAKTVKKVVSRNVGKLKIKKEPMKAKARANKVQTESKNADSRTASIKKESLKKRAKHKVKKEGEKIGKILKEQTNKMTTRKKGWRLHADPVELNRGVVYLSHIPHGFYEEEMKSYFSQFGVVTGVKMPRSKAGKSRGFAFIEFLHPEVAEIAADTMNNYLMYNRLVKAKYIPPSEQKPRKFSGKGTALQEMAERRRKMEERKNSRSLDKEALKKFSQKMADKIEALKKRLKEIGADYEFQVAYESNAFLKSIKAVDPDSMPIVKEEEDDLTKIKPKSPKQGEKITKNKKLKKEVLKTKRKEVSQEQKQEKPGTSHSTSSLSKKMVTSLSTSSLKKAMKTVGEKLMAPMPPKVSNSLPSKSSKPAAPKSTKKEKVLVPKQTVRGVKKAVGGVRKQVKKKISRVGSVKRVRLETDV